MNFSSVLTLRTVSQISLLFLITSHTLYAMEEEGNSSSHDLQCNFANAFQIKAIAKFHTRNETEKYFARYIVPRSIEYDAHGNVQTVDTLNVSIKTDKYPPMFNVFLEPVAINLPMRQMKLLCTTSNQYNLSQTVAVKMMVPLDEEYSADIPLVLIDETGQKVLLSIQTKLQ